MNKVIENQEQFYHLTEVIIIIEKIFISSLMKRNGGKENELKVKFVFVSMFWMFDSSSEISLLLILVQMNL